MMGTFRKRYYLSDKKLVRKKALSSDTVLLSSDFDCIHDFCSHLECMSDNIWKLLTSKLLFNIMGEKYCYFVKLL